LRPARRFAFSASLLQSGLWCWQTRRPGRFFECITGDRDDVRFDRR
jgi:hypothetical protein